MNTAVHILLIRMLMGASMALALGAAAWSAWSLWRGGARAVDRPMLWLCLAWVAFLWLTQPMAAFGLKFDAQALLPARALLYQLVLSGVGALLLAAARPEGGGLLGLWGGAQAVAFGLLLWSAKDGALGSLSEGAWWWAWFVVNASSGGLVVWRLWRAARRADTTRAWLALGAGVLALAIFVEDAFRAPIGLLTPTMVHFAFALYLLLVWIAAKGPLAIGDLPAGRDSVLGWRQVSIGSSGLEPAIEAVLADERQRIARELHDGVGSQLTQLLASLDPNDARQKAMMQGLEEVMLGVKMLVDEIYDQGQSLAQALGNLRYRLEAAFSRNGMDLVWDLQELDALEQMGGREAHEVLRIVQEAICNAMRHAQASTITVRTNLRPESGTLTIDVRDDGRGFKQRRGQPGGRGLLGMRERAAALGGSLQVFSAPGSGTCVRINLPVQVPQIS